MEPLPVETRKQAVERRLHALETHIQDLEDRLRPMFRRQPDGSECHCVDAPGPSHWHGWMRASSNGLPDGYRMPTASEFAGMSDQDLINGKLIHDD